MWTTCPRDGFGEFYWGIREPEFSADAAYVHRVIDIASGLVNIDRARIYFFGHSNGGIFACSLAVKLGNTFAAVGCSMGGWRGHMNEELAGYIEISEDTRRSLPLIIVTGDNDSYRVPCERARDIFMMAGHPVQFHMLDNTPHEYQPCCEDAVCSFFLSHALPAEIKSFWHVVGILRSGCHNQASYYYECLSQHLKKQPSFLSDLCATSLCEKMLGDFSTASDQAALHMIQILSMLFATQAISLNSHPRVYRCLWRIVESETASDTLRECAADVLFA